MVSLKVVATQKFYPGNNKEQRQWLRAHLRGIIFCCKQVTETMKILVYMLSEGRWPDEKFMNAIDRSFSARYSSSEKNNKVTYQIHSNFVSDFLFDIRSLFTLLQEFSRSYGIHSKRTKAATDSQAKLYSKIPKFDSLSRVLKEDSSTSIDQHLQSLYEASAELCNSLYMIFLCLADFTKKVVEKFEIKDPTSSLDSPANFGQTIYNIFSAEAQTTGPKILQYLREEMGQADDVLKADIALILGTKKFCEEKEQSFDHFFVMMARVFNVYLSFLKTHKIIDHIPPKSLSHAVPRRPDSTASTHRTSPFSSSEQKPRDAAISPSPINNTHLTEDLLHLHDMQTGTDNNPPTLTSPLMKKDQSDGNMENITVEDCKIGPSVPPPPPPPIPIPPSFPAPPPIPSKRKVLEVDIWQKNNLDFTDDIVESIFEGEKGNISFDTLLNSDKMPYVIAGNLMGTLEMINNGAIRLAIFNRLCSHSNSQGSGNLSLKMDLFYKPFSFETDSIFLYFLKAIANGATFRENDIHDFFTNFQTDFSEILYFNGAYIRSDQAQILKLFNQTISKQKSLANVFGDAKGTHFFTPIIAAGKKGGRQAKIYDHIVNNAYKFPAFKPYFNIADSSRVSGSSSSRSTASDNTPASKDILFSFESDLPGISQLFLNYYGEDTAKIFVPMASCSQGFIFGLKNLQAGWKDYFAMYASKSPKFPLFLTFATLGYLAPKTQDQETGIKYGSKDGMDLQMLVLSSKRMVQIMHSEFSETPLPAVLTDNGSSYPILTQKYIFLALKLVLQSDLSAFGEIGTNLKQLIKTQLKNLVRDDQTPIDGTEPTTKAYLKMFIESKEDLIQLIYSRYVGATNNNNTPDVLDVWKSIVSPALKKEDNSDSNIEPLLKDRVSEFSNYFECLLDCFLSTAAIVPFVSEETVHTFRQTLKYDGIREIYVKTLANKPIELSKLFGRGFLPRSRGNNIIEGIEALYETLSGYYNETDRSKLGDEKDPTLDARSLIASYINHYLNGS